MQEAGGESFAWERIEFLKGLLYNGNVKSIKGIVDMGKETKAHAMVFWINARQNRRSSYVQF